ncbi:MAG: hypothetical protein L3J67_07090, partial [Hyphomicrobiaceae bacterium]|nr:hypothetical protein [Hyphomicrobiaceae bacterium]
IVPIVEFMIASNIDDWFVGLIRRPLDAIGTNTNITGKNDSIGIRLRKNEIPELQMKVTQYMQLHLTISIHQPRLVGVL